MSTSPEYKYDAFISYSHKDQNWVRNSLLATLQNNGVKVIIDFRDFEPGAPSVKEMERAVKTSRKTIVVLSPSYINSAWTEFEFLMISTLDPAARERRLLPLLLEPCEIPLGIRYLSYLNFANRETAKLS